MADEKARGVIDDLRHLPQPDAFDLELSPKEFGVILVVLVVLNLILPT